MGNGSPCVAGVLVHVRIFQLAGAWFHTSGFISHTSRSTARITNRITNRITTRITAERPRAPRNKTRGHFVNPMPRNTTITKRQRNDNQEHPDPQRRTKRNSARSKTPPWHRVQRNRYRTKSKRKSPMFITLWVKEQDSVVVVNSDIYGRHWNVRALTSA